MTRAIRGGYYFRIGEGKARRSVVRAEDVAGLIPKLHGNSGIYNLTDGVNPMVSEIENYVAQSMKKSIRSIPPRVASWLAKAGDFIPAFPINSRKWNKLTQSLTFSDNLARQQLGWSPAPFYMDFLIG
jgi:nucleoside-diphosphate-sugar epimerase